VASEAQFKFTLAIQEKILMILWTDVKSYNIYRECIKPQYFQKAVHIDICRIIFDYWDKYDCPPTKEVLDEEIQNLVSRSKAKQKVESDYYSCVKKMSEMDINDYDYIRDKILDFGKKQAMIEAIMESAEIIEENKPEKYDQIDTIIRKAQMVGEDTTDLGVDYWENFTERLESYNDEEDVIERFPTGMNALDTALKGGLGRTEMGVCLAPPGRGKTSFLTNCGVNGLRAGKNVVHFSLENNEKQIIRNYDTAMLRHGVEYIQENTESCSTALGRIKDFGAGRLYVKKYPTKYASVSTIKMYLNRIMVAYGFKPDIIIIDYGALLKPMQTYADKRNTLEGNYEDMRALADEYNVALWTAAQGNRASLSKKIVTMEDLAEAFAIANIADVMVALCQTIRERSMGKLRAFLTKNRDGVGEVLLSGTIDYPSKRITLDEDITDSISEDDSSEDDSDNNSGYKGKKRKKEQSAYDKE
jgi:replicative DNA helicase